MEITLLDYKGTKHKVEIPDDTVQIEGEIISGDMVIDYPVYFDTGAKTRTMDFDDGIFVVSAKNFSKLETLRNSYEVFDLN